MAFKSRGVIGAILRSQRLFTGTGNVTMVNEGVLLVKKASGAATTVTLPPGDAFGKTVYVKDAKGDAATNNITVQPVSGTIDGASTHVIAANYGATEFMWNGTEWNRLGGNSSNAALSGQSLTVNGTLSPTAFAASADDLAVGANVFQLRVTTGGGGAQNFTGMTAGVDGRVVMIENIGTVDTITLKHSATSTAANQFIGPNSADVALRKNGSVYVVYDGASTKWRIMGA